MTWVTAALRKLVKGGDSLREPLGRVHAQAAGVSGAERAARVDQSLYERANQLRDELVAPAREALKKPSRLDELLQRFDADAPARDASARVLDFAAQEMKAGRLSRPELRTARQLAEAAPLRRALSLLKQHDMRIRDPQAMRGASRAERVKATSGKSRSKELFQSAREVEGEVSTQIRTALTSGNEAWMRRTREALMQPDAEGRQIGDSMASVSAVGPSFREALELTPTERAILEGEWIDPALQPGKKAARAAGRAAAGAGSVGLATLLATEMRRMRQDAEAPGDVAEMDAERSGPGPKALAPLAQEIGAPQARALQQLATLAHFAAENPKDRRAQLELDAALAAIGEVGPRRAAAQALRVAREGGQHVAIEDDLIVAADRLIAHFEKAPPPPVVDPTDDGEGLGPLPFVARPRQTRPDTEATAAPGEGERARPMGTEGDDAPPLLKQESVSVRAFQRRFNQVHRRLGAERIAADNIRGNQTDSAIATVFDAYGEPMPADADEALQRAHEIVQGWYVGDASLRKVQEFLIATLGPSVLPRFGPDGKWGAETQTAIQSLGIPGVDGTDGLTTEERNVIYYEYGLGNSKWREQKAAALQRGPS